ncbi:MAG: photosynthetic reaction center cytochrome c subunit [Gemmatimonadaceae bacterium]|nr:photosynthetic reaction center cytochrome c subunit [Gemmatimonadaceae bacterium]
MMITGHSVRIGALLSLVILGGCKNYPDVIKPGPKQVAQHGFRGVGMETNYDPDDIAKTAAYNQAPKPLPPAPPGPPGQYRNVQVLTNISAAEFGRTMTAMSAWVAGGPGNCAYCHNTANFASDSTAKGELLYTKLTARMMLRMTRRINSDYTRHVGGTGVTCYTCHRGQPLPNGIWFYSDQNQILRHYLDRDDIRVQSHSVEPLPGAAANRTSIRQTYNTYALMATQSKALGVNCTYCHNSRAWTSWEESTPKRVVAMYGASMLRDLNMNYLNPLQPVYPRSRLGEHGDAPKAQCITCHNGVYKPLYGAKMVSDYPALWGAAGWDATAGPLDATGKPLFDGAPLTEPGVTPSGAKMSAAPTTATAPAVEVAMGVTPVSAMPAVTTVPARPTP